ncbi:V-set and transmembrane domain-containing protein 2A [Arapaima gigas]
MWTFGDSVGFAFIFSFCLQFGFSFQGRFTELPSNLTAKEGQDVEMACAFQSGTSSVYLEIQWWFIKAPEEQNSSEEDTGSQVFFKPCPRTGRIVVVQWGQ